MNMNVLALMFAITVFAVGTLIYALISGEPFLMLAMVAVVAVAFSPWHRWR
jgi:hypothetical protein